MLAATVQSCPSAPSLSTAVAAAHSWLFYFFVFFSSFSHTCSHPLLHLFIGALALRLQPTYFPSPFKSTLNIAPLTLCCLSPPISTYNTKQTA
jgi:hypothetical protein